MTNCYVTKQQAKTLIQRLKSFEASLYNVFDSYGYDLNENLGRKNALLSQAQEKELGKILRKEYGGDDVIVDGRPGQPGRVRGLTEQCVQRCAGWTRSDLVIESAVPSGQRLCQSILF